MLKPIAYLREEAKQQRVRIVLPEAEDPRVLKASDYINREKLADLILLGDKKKIENASKDKGLDLKGIEIIEPLSSEDLGDFSNRLYQLRKHKGMTQEDARDILIKKPVYFGAMMVREKKADGFVAGATYTTRDVARSAIYCVGVDSKIGTMSSSFIMALDDESFGEKGVFIFADCAIIPEPSSKQLANIAISASDLMQMLFQAVPRVAILSFSTKGSGATSKTEKLLKAVEDVKQMRPDLIIDGELQADAALVPEIAKTKSPDSPIAGKANILIFPNLGAGNIAYKLIQRLTRARAIGPLLHGLLAPCSDLSRGCDADDIIDVVCVTAIRYVHNKVDQPISG